MHLELVNLMKRFGATVAVDRVSFRVEKAEFVSILGPSGCGKTTILNLLGGFLAPDEGEIRIGAQTVNDLPPNRRPTSMVFQNYALFPHMTVFANVAFGLKMRRMPRAERARRVAEVLRLVKLEDLDRRYPSALSGGQQQRVALARSLVIEPSILLLDEPFSNLDARLRGRMREELRQLQRSLGITTLFVTHDQEEAFTLSDRILLMRNGRIEQSGTAFDLYDRPDTEFAMDFIGKTNRLNCVVDAILGEGMIVKSDAGLFDTRLQEGAAVGDVGILVIRPDRVRLQEEPPESNSLAGVIVERFYLGPTFEYSLASEAGSFSVSLGGRERQFSAGSKVYATWKRDDCWFFAPA